MTAHDWGGIVIHDATTVDQAEKAVLAGIDGLMLVCAGAGGLGGLLNSFAFVARVRAIFDGIIQLAGGIATGRDIAAAQVLGADMVCMGTRFIATLESGVADGHKQMLVMIGVLAGFDGSFDAVPLIMRNQTLSPVSGLPVRGTDRRRHSIRGGQLAGFSGNRASSSSISGSTSIPKVVRKRVIPQYMETMKTKSTSCSRPIAASTRALPKPISAR